MPLKAIHDTLEEIPEEFRELYTEKDKKFELTGIQGIKTPADIGRLQRSIDAEKDAHKATKATLGNWTGLGELEEVQGKLDKYPELEAASKGNLNDDEIDKIAQKRAEGIVKSQMAPVERKSNKMASELEEAKVELTTLRGEKVSRSIQDDLRVAMAKEKILPEFHEDVLMWGDKVMEINDEGKAVTKDGIGITPGLDGHEWLQSMNEKRQGWWPGSKGGGSRGSGGGGGFGGGKNPFSDEGWNMTQQGQVMREKGAETAKRMAEAAGTSIGGARPKPKT